MKSYNVLRGLIELRGVHPEFGDAGEGWGIEQNPHELATFLVRMQELGVQSVLEIGTGYKGGLSRFLAQDMGWDVTTVDIQNYGHVFTGVHYIVGEGKWLITRDEWFDLIFIDGDHSYQSVQNDYYDYAFHARLAFAFHDICGLRNCEGAQKFWNSLLPTSPGAHEIIEPSGRRSGIGYIDLIEQQKWFNSHDPLASD